MRAFKMAQIMKTMCDDGGRSSSSSKPYTLDPSVICKNFNTQSTPSEYLMVSTRDGLVTVSKKIKKIDQLKTPLRAKTPPRAETPPPRAETTPRAESPPPQLVVSLPPATASTSSEVDVANLPKTRHGKVGCPYFPVQYSNSNRDDLDEPCSSGMLIARSKFMKEDRFKDNLKCYERKIIVEQHAVVKELKDIILAERDETSFEQGIVRVIFTGGEVSLVQKYGSVIRKFYLNDLQSLSRSCRDQIFEETQDLLHLRRLLRFAGLIIDYNYDYVIEDSCDQIKRLYVMGNIIDEMAKRPLVPMSTNFEATKSVQEAMKKYYHIFYNYLAPVSQYSTFVTRFEMLEQPPRSKLRYKFRLEAMSKYLTLLFINFASANFRPIDAMAKIFYGTENLDQLNNYLRQEDLKNIPVSVMDLVKKIPFNRLLQLILMYALGGICSFHPAIMDIDNKEKFLEYWNPAFDGTSALKLIGLHKDTWDVVKVFCSDRLFEIYKSVASGKSINQDSHVLNIEILAMIVEEGVKRMKNHPSNFNKSLDELYNNESQFKHIIETSYLMSEDNEDNPIEVFNNWGKQFFNSEYEYSFNIVKSPMGENSGILFKAYLSNNAHRFIILEKPSE